MVECVCDGCNDFDEPVFEDLIPNRFRSLQLLIENTRTLLWVTAKSKTWARSVGCSAATERRKPTEALAQGFSLSWA